MRRERGYSVVVGRAIIHYMTTSAEQPIYSAKSTLIAWANGQEGWVRSILADILSASVAPSEQRLDEYYEQMLVEKGLQPGTKKDVVTIVDSTATAVAGRSVTLTSLTEVSGVNALAPGQEITFGPKATVLFGENGVGKTGYVRILKLVADVRKASNVLPDIAGPATVTPSAIIKCESDGTAAEVVWKGERGVDPLSQMDVFDSRATQIHLDDDLSFVYTPQELGLFKLVRDVVERLKERLRSAREERLRTAGASATKFTVGTAVEQIVSKLGAETDLAALKTLGSLTAEEEQALAKQRLAVAALQANATDVALSVARSDREMFSKVKASVSPFRLLDTNTYATALKELLKARSDHEQVTRSALAGENIPGVLGEAWKKFITAGQEYLDADVPAHELTLGDPCIYCRQPLKEAAVVLAQKYHAYCKASRKPVEDARDKFTTACGECVTVDVGSAQRLVTTKIEGLEEGQVSSLLTQADKVLTALAECQAAMKQEAAIERLPDDLEATAITAADQIVELDEQIRKHRLAGTERAEVLATERKKLQELEDRATLAIVLPELTKKVEDAKWAKSAKTVLAKMATLSTALTTAMKEASEALINSDFSGQFEIERKALSAPMVKLEFPGTDTIAARRKSLTDRHKLSEILSEGEQRVVALADFLAEATLRPRPTPIIFDDPVNSLDYRRLEGVAKRIAELSKTRQVIIFTHNIWFTIELLDRLGKTAVYYDVTSGKAGKGIITGSTGPRTDSIRQLEGKIKDRLQKAAKESGEVQIESLEKICGWMRSYCEVLAETELLQGVTGRYQPNVRVENLERITGTKLDAAVGVVVPIYRTLCRRINAHSQPRETLNVRPKLEEIAEEWKQLKDARTAFGAG